QNTGFSTGIRVVNGTKSLTTNLDPTPDTAVTSVNVLPGSVPQAFAMKRNNIAGGDLLVLADTAFAGSNVIIGHIYYDGNCTNASQTLRITGTFQAGAKFSAVVGDYNNDGFDDILIGVTETGANRVGRVYLLPSSATTVIGTVSLDSSKYIWEGPGLGAVYSV